MDNKLTEISYRQMDNGIWRVTFNGNILGDSRGYPTRQAVETAAIATVDKDHADARRYNRPVMYIYRPYSA